MFDEFGQPSVICQTLTSQMLAYKINGILMAKIYPFTKLYFAYHF